MGPDSKNTQRQVIAGATAVKQDGWQFVNLSGARPSATDKELKKLIRTNAMRDYRRKQKQEVKQNSDQIPVPDSAPASAPVSTRSVLFDLAWRPALPSLLMDNTFVGPIEAVELPCEQLPGVCIENGDPDSEDDACVRAVHSAIHTSPHYKDCSYCVAASNPDPMIVLSSGSVDPFDVFPIGGKSRNHSRILNHCEPFTSPGCLY